MYKPITFFIFEYTVAIIKKFELLDLITIDFKPDNLMFIPIT